MAASPCRWASASASSGDDQKQDLQLLPWPLYKRKRKYQEEEESLYRFCPYWRQLTEKVGFRSIKWNWEDLTVAGDTLKPVRDAGVWNLILKKREDINLENSLITSTSIAQIRSLLFGAIRQQPPISVRPMEMTKMITDSDISCFSRLVEKARADWYLYHVCSFDIAAIVEHDSTIDGVMEQLPDSMIRDIPEHRSRIRMLVDTVRDWRKIELCHQFARFLPECQEIQVTAPVSENLENIQQTPTFKDKKFGDIPVRKLTYILEEYLDYMTDEYLRGEPKVCYLRMIESDHQQEYNAYLKERERVLQGLWSPIHFLVHQQHNMNAVLHHGDLMACTVCK